LKLKPNGSHFDTIEVIEVESQAVLNTFTEHDFKDASKNWQKRWEQRIRTEADYFEGDGGSVGSNLVLDQMASPVPEIIDGSLHLL
jgi:hypothetical protein